MRAVEKCRYIQIYIRQDNHAKVYSTGRKMYIGSANATEQSSNNVEFGVLIEDKQAIESLEGILFFEGLLDSYPIFADAYFHSELKVFFSGILGIAASLMKHIRLCYTNPGVDVEGIKNNEIKIKELSSKVKTLLCTFKGAVRGWDWDNEKFTQNPTYGEHVNLILQQLDQAIQACIGQVTSNYLNYSLKSLCNSANKEFDLFRMNMMYGNQNLKFEEYSFSILRSIYESLTHLRTWSIFEGPEVTPTAIKKLKFTLAEWLNNPSLLDRIECFEEL
ncbi:phospholipase D-like domain-containing protein [Alicyclobacillus dauci]|uniref:PLD phosphodiesterase domain-containing protein n=1 Tax=Alicyclobacillus dauci TaxID=1475485 RepID=A0ABY6Z8I7_9BACL|nr:hypothetical protein [Alicyclobacillus dauci]WAH39028.1 hypothetical protein NZD86_11360 [Alicyclobacillus dauci]